METQPKCCGDFMAVRGTLFIANPVQYEIH